MTNRIPNRDEKNDQAIIIGASLSGLSLMTGITLAEEGIAITILEKVSEEPRTGSGIQVNSGSPIVRKRLSYLEKSSGMVERSTIESCLRIAALANPKIDIRYNIEVETVGQDEYSAWVVTENGENFDGDILIGTDGP